MKAFTQQKISLIRLLCLGAGMASLPCLAQTPPAAVPAQSAATGTNNATNASASAAATNAPRPGAFWTPNPPPPCPPPGPAAAKPVKPPPPLTPPDQPNKPAAKPVLTAAQTAPVVTN